MACYVDRKTMTINDSLLAEYLSVLSDIRDFRQYQQRVLKRAMCLYISKPLNLLRDNRIPCGKDIDFLSGTTDSTTSRSPSDNDKIRRREKS